MTTSKLHRTSLGSGSPTPHASRVTPQCSSPAPARTVPAEAGARRLEALALGAVGFT